MDSPTFKAGQHQVILLHCHGAYHAQVVDQRWVRIRCKRTRCRVPGTRTFHIFDLYTGAMRTEQVPVDTEAGETT